VQQLARCMVACRRSETILRVLALARKGDMLCRTAASEESLRKFALMIEQERVRERKARGRGKRGRQPAVREDEASTSDMAVAARRAVQAMTEEGDLMACLESLYALADDIRRDLAEET
jgi:hypothetical protein